MGGGQDHAGRELGGVRQGEPQGARTVEENRV